MPLECPQEVADDFEKLLETGERYDVIIYAGENENVKEIHAHSIVLCSRSQYFHTTFSNNGWSEKKDGKFIFKKPNISPKLFNMILRFIYCGKIDLEKLRGPDIIKLLIVVNNEFNIQTLISYIQEYLIEHQYVFLQQNPIEILEVFYQHEAFIMDLWNFCLEKICEKPEELFNSDKFISLKAPVLELLLKQDHLSLDETVIWDKLIKWCLAQNPSVSQDVIQWNKEEITIMEKTIHIFIPLIRFYHLSPDDFMAKVYPFKMIMPEDLVNNILTFHMVSSRPNIDIQPPRTPMPKRDYDSIIINNKHIAIFSSWIEKKKDSYYNVRNIPYDFNLFYRASRDGNTNTEFHAKCDNKGATIVIIKIQNSEQIVGGYNPLYWDSSNTDKSTYDSFLFSFTSKDNPHNAKVSYSNGSQYSISSYSTHGPVFGGGDDLSFYGGVWGSDASSYSNIDIPTIFHADDYEVFQVIKKPTESAFEKLKSFFH